MQEITDLQNTFFPNIAFIVLLILFADYNGFINLWGLTTNKNKKASYSDSWHFQGMAIRFVVVVLVLVYEGLFWGWIASIFGWHMFDLLINKRRGHAWYYLGEKYEKHFKLIWAGKIIWLLAGLLLLI